MKVVDGRPIWQVGDVAFALYNSHGVDEVKDVIVEVLETESTSRNDIYCHIHTGFLNGKRYWFRNEDLIPVERKL